MHTDRLKQLARQFMDDTLSAESFWQELRALPETHAADVTLDLDRQRRCGFPEVVFGEGKSTATICTIAEQLLKARQPVLVTRVSPEQAHGIQVRFAEAIYNPVARTLRVPPAAAASSQHPRLKPGAAPPTNPAVAVVVISAGTTDRGVAEEAYETLMWMDVPARLIQDVGVAGPQRLDPHVPILRSADAIVVVAGMEGALPSVVAGHVPCPVIAVPTSVGYGANLDGFAALLSMLNSCAANVVVVNIDAGFRGGYAAGLIARGKRRSETHPQGQDCGDAE